MSASTHGRPSVHRILTRRRLLATSAAGLAAGAVACGRNSGKSNQSSAPQGSSATPQTGGTLNAILFANATTLDPQGTLVGFTLDPASGVHSRLLQFQTGTDPIVGENHVVQPDLATSVESPDAVTWTVKLRTDATFQNIAPVNGHAVEAEDVKATFVRATNPKEAGAGGLGMLNANQIETPAKDTVVFKLNYPYAPFKSVIASSIYSWILPREALAGSYDLAKTMIGSGPFILDRYTPDVELVLKKNPAWFVKGRPYIDTLHWSINGNTAQGEAQFDAGHVDMVGGTNSVVVPASDVATLQQQSPKAQIVKVPSAGILIYVQLGDPNSPFQDIRLRRAVSMAIDRNALAKAAYGDQVDTAEPMFYSSTLGKWGLHPSDLPQAAAQYYQYNPSEVKKLLQESGNADRQFKLVYALGYTGAVYERAAQTVGSMLANSGFKVNTVELDFVKDFVAGGKGIRYGNYPSDTIVALQIAPYEDIDQYLFNYFDPKGTTNICRVDDPALTGMISKARAVVDDDQRLKAFMDAQKYVADKMYEIGGNPSPWQFNFLQPRVQNYQQSYGYGFVPESYTKLWLQQ